MLNLGILVSGGGTNLQAIIDSIGDGRITNARINVVISNKDGVYALTRARENHIHAEVVSPKKYEDKQAFHQALLEKLQEYGVNFIVLAGYLVVIPELIIKHYAGRIINVHPSLIPSFCGSGYYGLKVHEAALNRGVKLTGATVHFVDEGTDTGPIILQKAVEVLEGDTPEVLQKRVMEEAEWDILPKAINLIANSQVVLKNGCVRII
ncbi:formyltetrahydrofolate-dependent phosphoribosylglycinamide formyltransferase [Anaerocolumna jejuensis DSM 15929]|uniref:Phosphoribosylglycinamide formyltransferase n=1 Tax=Anaerocolumna jejuensis DSM 15929 TaxID=1121322 RepID=A0A1M6R6F7_9FIRM|nr:phosphoribosylglycinamide formyltransferase [Anaerocolumna jejuensis]SHK27938.1 formyltetrahydrofolate-dependent phosphoribosylglycinamide formyltransferase [Anaerocolumna jejuensis DSM 15929]